MEKRAVEDLAASGVDTSNVQFQWFYDAAYWGQAHELIVSLGKGRFQDVADLRAAFDQEHERIYTFMMPNDRVNFFHWRLNAVVSTDFARPRPTKRAARPAPVERTRRDAFFGGKAGKTEIAVYDGRTLFPGEVIHGPAVIEEPTTSITVFPGHAVRVSLLGYDYRVSGNELSGAAQ